MNRRRWKWRLHASADLHVQCGVIDRNSTSRDTMKCAYRWRRFRPWLARRCRPQSGWHTLARHTARAIRERSQAVAQSTRVRTFRTARPSAAPAEARCLRGGCRHGACAVHRQGEWLACPAMGRVRDHSAAQLFQRGQSTNCRLNALILKVITTGRHLDVHVHLTSDPVLLETRLITAVQPPWNIRS